MGDAMTTVFMKVLVPGQSSRRCSRDFLSSGDGTCYSNTWGESRDISHRFPPPFSENRTVTEYELRAE